MCGRSYFASKRSITSNLKIDKIGNQALNMSKQSQLLPGKFVPTIVLTEKYGKVLTSSHWGFGDIYNARAESIELVGLWSQDYFTHRAILPLQSFYEGKWFEAEDEKPLWAAAVYRPMKVDDKKYIETSMITIEANQAVREYHHRMPALVPVEQVDAWLSFEKGVYDVISHESTPLRIV